MEIVSPQYSFIKFDSPESIDNCCDGEQDFCIPIIEENDTWFQFKITSTSYAEIQALMSGPIEDLQLVLLNGTGNNAVSIAANTLRNWTADDSIYFERYRTGLYEVTYQWRGNFKDIKTLLSCNDCFQIAVIKMSDPTTGEFSDEFSDEFDTDTALVYELASISNCLKRICGDCYTTVLEYYNEEDYAGFNYCNILNPVNRVRLPFYLTQPKHIEE